MLKKGWTIEPRLLLIKALFFYLVAAAVLIVLCSFYLFFVLYGLADIIKMDFKIDFN